MCITEYNEKTFVNGIREEGRIEERKQMVTNALKKGKSVAEVADFLDLTEEEVKAIQDKVCSMA